MTDRFWSKVHPFDEANTYQRPGGKLHRECRVCDRERKSRERIVA